MLFRSLNGGYRSDHLNEVEPKLANDTTGGVVDDMDDYEKESILEVKMTQLAIIELLEGPKVAVNASIELLTLYSRLFGVPHPKVSIDSPMTRSAPKSSAGTLRTIKGSIFGSRHERHSRARQSIVPSEKTLAVPSRPQTTQTTAGSIDVPLSQVGSESGTLTESRRSRKSASVTRGGEQMGKRNSLRKRESSGSRRRAVSSGAVSHQPSVVDGEGFFTPSEDTSTTPSNHELFTATSKRVPSGGHRPFSISESHTLNGSARARNGNPLAGISVDTLEPHPALLPVIQFSRDYHTRRRTAVLVQVWLMTAGLYRRAGMYADAEGATAEAKKLVQSLEAEVASDASGVLSLSLKNAGWGGKKSVEELWADYWAEVSLRMPFTVSDLSADERCSKQASHSPRTNHTWQGTSLRQR